MERDDARLAEAVRSLVHAAPHEPDVGAFLHRFRARRRRVRVVRSLRLAGAAVVATSLAAAVTVAYRGSTDDARPARPRPVGDVVALPRLSFDVDVGFGAAWVLTAKHVLKVDARTHDIAERVRIHGEAQYVEVGEGAVWTAGGGVRRIDPASARVTGHVRGYVNTIALGDGWLWRNDGDGYLTRIDPRTLEESGRVRVARDLGDLESRASHDLAAGFGAAWFGDGTTGELVRVDARTLSVERIALGSPMRGGEGPYVDTVVTGGGLVWACCDAAGRIVALDPATRRARATVPAGGGDAMSFGGERLWMSTFLQRAGRSFDALVAVDVPPAAVEQGAPRYLGHGIETIDAGRVGVVVKSPSGLARPPVLRFLPYDEIESLPTGPPEPRLWPPPWSAVLFLVVLSAVAAGWLWLTTPARRER